MKRVDAIDWDVLLAVLTVMLLALLAVLVFAGGSANAGACLSIDVPPQAVIHQPDGDTFHLFSMQAGGVVKIRVQGADTPERTEPKWAEAREFTRLWLSRGPFQLSTCGKPTLDRIVATVSRNGRTLAQDLIDLGLTK